MDTMLVRLKPFDPRRGHVLRRYTYAGIKFQEERGWYRVAKAVADYLKKVHCLPGDDYSPLAFDVCTEEEAKRLEQGETEATKVKRSAMDELQVAEQRGGGALTTEALGPTSSPTSATPNEKAPRRSRRE